MKYDRTFMVIVMLIAFISIGIKGYTELPAPTPDPGDPASIPPTPIPYSVYGDVNNDNEIDIIDALLIAQYYIGITVEDFYPAFADVNDDDEIDIVDALLVAQYYVGIIPGF